MSNTYGWIAIAAWAFHAAMAVYEIGKERKPVTTTHATITVVITVIVIGAVLWAMVTGNLS